MALRYTNKVSVLQPVNAGSTCVARPSRARSALAGLCKPNITAFYRYSHTHIASSDALCHPLLITAQRHRDDSKLRCHYCLQGSDRRSRFSSSPGGYRNVRSIAALSVANRIEVPAAQFTLTDGLQVASRIKMVEVTYHRKSDHGWSFAP
jgi:hypothetical protein